MKIKSCWRWRARMLVPAPLLLACAMQAHAMTDLYSNGLLVMSSLMIGTANLSNVSVTVKSIVTPPSGTSPNGFVDTYDPASGRLTVQSVSFNGHTFYNAVVDVDTLVAIGGVAGADAYTATGPGGGNLAVSHVLLAGTIYDNVVLAVSLANVVGLAGGMPAATTDSYSDGLLSVPIVAALGHIYTNATLSVQAGNIKSVGGSHTGVLSTGFNSDGTTTTSGLPLGSYGPYAGAQNSVFSVFGGAYVDISQILPSTSHEYVQISDLLGNIGNFEQEGIFIQPAMGQAVSAGGFGSLSVTVGENPEWSANAMPPNFVVLMTTNVPGVSTTLPPCNPQLAAVVTASTFVPVPYTLPLSAFTNIVQTCGATGRNLTYAQILAGNIVQIDIQADGGAAAITASGLTSNVNLTVPSGASAPLISPTDNYPTRLTVAGGVNFAP